MNPFAAGYRETAQQHVDKLAPGTLVGKTIFITGCTSGIGIETARALIKGGATVFISGRNRSKLESVRANLISDITTGQGNSRNTIESRIKMIVMDLSSLSSVRNGAKEFLSQSSSLHILICNAGVMALKYGLSADGVDTQFATNHIGHFLLFQLLKDVMLRSTSSRLVVVSSSASYYFADPNKGIDYSRLPSVNEASYSKWGAYQQSKLANVLFALEVNHRYSNKGLTAYSLHPGGIKTGLQDDVGSSSILFRFFAWITDPIWKTTEQGAATSVYCAITPGIEEHGGQFFDNSRVTERNTQNKIRDGEAEKLWKWTEEFLATRTAS